MAFIDLAHLIHHGMETYPGLPCPAISAHMDRAASKAHYADDTSFHIGRIDMVANTGTYVDAPFHRFADGGDVADLPLDRLAERPVRLLRVPDARRAIDAELLDDLLGAAALEHCAVLIATGFDARFGTPAYFEDHPFLTADAAIWLAERNPALVGIDSLNIDDLDDGRRPVHTTLLGAGIPIAEHLKALVNLPARGARFTAVPAPVRGMGTFPVRAYATVDAP